MSIDDNLRVLVCGGRDYKDYNVMRYILKWEFYSSDHYLWTLICGMAKGADSLAYKWAKSFDVPVLEFPADWKNLGKSAGSIRNRQMLNEGRPDRVIAFPGGIGTAHMVRISKEAGVPVLDLRDN